MRRYKERAFYLFVAPWIIGFVLFQGGPILGSLALSLSEWQPARPPQWVGLMHYQAMLGDALVGRTLLNTALYALGTVGLGLVLSFVLAWLLDGRVRGAAALRTIFFLPIATFGVAMTFVWGWLFNARWGLINQALALAGIRGPAWLQDPHWAMPALIMMGLWGIGGNIVVYLAGLQTIPRELDEAATLDGANLAQRWRSVTLPLLSPVTFFLGVMGVIGAFQLFTPSYLLTRGGPDNATLTTALYIYQNAFLYQRFSYAAALAWLLCMAIIGLTWAQFRLARHWVYYENTGQ
jgi:multiple sugar transport system permease protein